jgi:chemotaxis response regulator CheB
MDEECRVFIIGDSLFTDTLVQLMANTADMKVVGTAPASMLASTAVAEARPHVIIVADASEKTQDKLGSILSLFPDLPLISLDLSRDYVQVITSRRVQTRRDDLLVAIRELSAQK